MKSGIVACATGRPGNWLVFSLVGGHSWQNEYRFLDESYPICSSNNTVLEVAPDTILVIYDRNAAGGEVTPRREIVGTFFKVKK